MRESERGVIKKITILFFSFLLLLTVFVVLYTNWMQQQEIKNREETWKNEIVALNEIQKLTEVTGKSPAEKEIQALMNEIRKTDETGKARNVWDKQKSREIRMIYFGVMIFLLWIYWYLYRIILKPFQKLERYAGEIARGNLDISLEYERKNIFGAFTWAFDQMRCEIKAARKNEQEAIENNKTVIATLSHDIKTPIASIRAYTEALEANMDFSAERRERYIAVILKKCDEVAALTNDLFLHSLSDMEKLQVVKKPEQIDKLIQETVEELSGGQENIVLKEPIIKAEFLIDKKRFKQVVTNIISNARKYAPNAFVIIWMAQTDDAYEIHIKDEGHGVPPEDVPFLFEKFYRGKNVEQEDGAGLGLYIVRYIMRQMGGEAILANYSEQEGLEFVLKFFSEQKIS